MELHKAVVVVTGASSGIGAATAAAVDRAGSRVALLARSEDRIRELTVKMSDAIAVPCDVTNHNDVIDAVNSVLDRYGRIDVLINNAGQTLVAPIGQIGLDDFRAILELNLIAPLAMMQAVLPVMRSQGSGTIINVSSGITLQPFVGSGAYAASKAGLNQLSAVARMELFKSGITVSTVLPSLTRTNLLSAGRGASDDPDGFAGADAPEKVADVIVELIRSGKATADLVPVDFGGTYTG